jgi:nitrogen fixation protein FixH
MAAAASARQGALWAYVPVVLLVAMLGGLGVLTSIAVDDPAFAIEKDYYQKAVSWDRELAQQQQNAELGWHAELELRALPDRRPELRAVLLDARRQPIRDAKLSVEAFPNARAEQRLSLRLEPDESGAYRAVLAARRGGLWEFRLRAVRGNEQYTEIVRQDVPWSAP